MRKLNTPLNEGIRRHAVVAAAPSPSLTVLSQCDNTYGYNAQSRFISRGAAESAEKYAYAYDPIGNRQTASNLGAARIYTIDHLNPYTQISTLRPSAPPRETFIPLFDDDGNQTLIQTKTDVRCYNHMAGPSLRGKRVMRITT